MIKFATGKIIGIGLSEENIKRLKKNDPIMFDMKAVGIPGKKCVIFYGKTEAEMQQDLSMFIGPKTKYESDIDN